MNTDHEIAAVRRRLGNEVNRGGKRVFDSAAKDAATALARARQSHGHSVASTARLIGLHPVVLASWMRRAPTPAPFAPLVVREPKDARSERSTPREIVATHGASGLRIEGLSVAQLAELLRGLR
jgi:transposase-like protein